MRVAEECDRELEREGLNPARKFRALRKRGDQEYLERYVKFYQFKWL